MNTWKLEKSRDRLCHAIHGVLHGQRIRTYWWGSKKNFGDLITPALLLAYGYTPVYEKSIEPSYSVQAVFWMGSRKASMARCWGRG
jgi:hypothetical protein